MQMPHSLEMETKQQKDRGKDFDFIRVLSEPNTYKSFQNFQKSN